MSIWASLLLAIGGPSGSLCSHALRVPAVAKSSFVADASRRHMICSAMVNKVNHITEILEPTNERLMEILTKAMAEIEARKFRGENVFLDVEDLHLYLDRDDREAFDKAQKKHKMAAKELHDFERRYREKRNELMPVEPVKVKKGKGKGGKGKGKRGQDEVKVLPEGEVLQRDVKQYTPPGASIWRGNTKGTWNGHFPPFRRISCPWKLIGCRKSCLEVLRRLWVQYLRSKGQTLADCTVQGMFTVAEVEQDDIEFCTD